MRRLAIGQRFLNRPDLARGRRLPFDFFAMLAVSFRLGLSGLVSFRWSAATTYFWRRAPVAGWTGYAPALRHRSPNPLRRERRSAAREARRARGQSIGRPKALDDSKAALARRMHAAGEPVSVIGQTLGVSRATVYRVLADGDSEEG